MSDEIFRPWAQHLAKQMMAGARAPTFKPWSALYDPERARQEEAARVAAGEAARVAAEEAAAMAAAEAAAKGPIEHPHWLTTPEEIAEWKAAYREPLYHARQAREHAEEIYALLSGKKKPEESW